MKRRIFLVSVLAAGLPVAGRALTLTGVPYTPGLVEKELAAGKTVFVDFYTDWCVTCAAQRRIVERLKAGNPAYGRAISFVAVDWDVYSDSKLAKRLNIPRRSTLVVLKGKQELGRIVAGTREADIRKLMDTALAAAA